MGVRLHLPFLFLSHLHPFLFCLRLCVPLSVVRPSPNAAVSSFLDSHSVYTGGKRGRKEKRKKEKEEGVCAPHEKDPQDTNKKKRGRGGVKTHSHPEGNEDENTHTSTSNRESKRKRGKRKREEGRATAGLSSPRPPPSLFLFFFFSIFCCRASIPLGLVALPLRDSLSLGFCGGACRTALGEKHQTTKNNKTTKKKQKKERYRLEKGNMFASA